jgi:hypothetical protein
MAPIDFPIMDCGLRLGHRKQWRIGQRKKEDRQTVALFIPVSPFDRLSVQVPWTDTSFSGAQVSVHMASRHQFEDPDIDSIAKAQVDMEPKVFGLHPDKVLPIGLRRHADMAVEYPVAHEPSIPVWEPGDRGILTTIIKAQLAQRRSAKSTK